MRNTSFTASTCDSQSGPDSIREEYRKDRKIAALIYLWVPVVLIFGVGDILTTQFAMSLGATERNDIIRFLIEGPGGVWAFSIVKAAIMVPLVMVSISLEGFLRWLIPVFFMCAGVCLLSINLSVIGSLL